LAPGTQQVECEDIEEGTTDAEQYIYFNPDRPTDHTNYDLGDDLGVANTTVEITSHAKRMVLSTVLCTVWYICSNVSQSFLRFSPSSLHG
jgi:hypothetical protein